MRTLVFVQLPKLYRAFNPAHHLTHSTLHLTDGCLQNMWAGSGLKCRYKANGCRRRNEKNAGKQADKKTSQYELPICLLLYYLCMGRFHKELGLILALAALHFCIILSVYRGRVLYRARTSPLVLRTSPKRYKNAWLVLSNSESP